MDMIRIGGRTALFVLMNLGVAGCQVTAGKVTQVASAPTATTMGSEAAKAPAHMPREIHWYRNSANQRTMYAQGYQYAHLIVERGRLAAQGSWAVVLDLDETVLDNSQYQWQQAQKGESFTPDSWKAWVLERRAVAFVPAREFIHWVKSQGGHVIAVTNRIQSLCVPTVDNLVAQDVAVDGVLCAPDSVDPPEKESRFKAIRDGSALPGVGPQQVLLYMGDQITDCPGQTESTFDVTKFGTQCIAFPNPMYGSWTSNPER